MFVYCPTFVIELCIKYQHLTSLTHTPTHTWGSHLTLGGQFIQVVVAHREKAAQTGEP